MSRGLPGVHRKAWGNEVVKQQHDVFLECPAKTLNQPRLHGRYSRSVPTSVLHLVHALHFHLTSYLVWDFEERRCALAGPAPTRTGAMRRPEETVVFFNEAELDVRVTPHDTPCSSSFDGLQLEWQTGQDMSCFAKKAVKQGANQACLRDCSTSGRKRITVIASM